MIVSVVSIVVACLVVIATWWLVTKPAAPAAAPSAVVQRPATVPDLVPVAAPPAIVTDTSSSGNVDTYAGTSAGEVDSEFKLLEFTFEHKLLPGRVPDASTKMVVKPAGFAPFKFVSCQSTGYAIRWMNRYLSLKSSSELAWTTEKQEPNSCFKVVSGYCDGTTYIMLRSLFNNHFLRVDGDTNKLVCVDSPTRNNADQYCWRLASDDPVGMPCGPQFLPDYGRVVNIPCEIKATPPCGEATPGFKSACCLRHPDDPTCAGSVFREVMGRPLAEAALYIKTRQPGLTIKKCEQTDPVCTKLKPFPIPEPDTVVLPYDKRLGIVSGPAFRFV